MKTKLTLLLAVFVPLATHAADDLSAALQKGLFEEEANQNLPAAIHAYQSLLAASDEQRKLAATALFRLGECYRKLGQTNDAIAQYQRLVRDFADQTTLTTLSRQNLRGLGVFPASATQGTDQRVLSPTSMEAQARLKELLQSEIDIAERFAAEMRKRIEVGTLSPGEEVRFERDVLGLKRQLAAVDGLSSIEDRRQWRDLLLHEIELAESAVKIEQKKLESGRSVASEVARLQRDVLILKRELVTFETAPPAVTGRDVQSDGTLKDYRSRVDPSSEAAQSAALLKQLQDLSRTEIVRVLPTVVSDPLLNSLLEQLSQAERKRAELETTFAKDHPNVKAIESTLKQLDQQIAEQIDGIMKGLAIKAAVLRQQADRTTGIPAPTDEEEKEIRRIQALIKNSPDLINDSSKESTPLHQAASKGQLVVARFLLENGANLDQQTYYNKGSALLLAAAQGHKSMVELLLAKGANPNLKDREGATALHEAAAKGFTSVVEVLLESKAEVDARNKNDETPLHLAVAAAQTAVVEALLQRGADINARRNNGDTPLHFAAGRGDVSLITLLLNRGADINARNESDAPPLWAALDRGHTKAIRTLLEKGASTDFTVDDISPIHRAVRINFVELVQLLLEHNAQPDLPNRSGVTPLQSVVLDGRNPELVGLLVKAGANSNRPLPASVQIQVRSGNSSFMRPLSLPRYPMLFAAILKQDIPMVEALLANGADVNSTSPEGNNYTALMSAINESSQELVDVMLRHKPDLEVRTTREGRTALQQAVAIGDLKATEALLKAGAKMDATDGNGWTPLHVAVEISNPELVRTLLQAGANPNFFAVDGTLPLSIVRRTSGRSLPMAEVRQELNKLLLQRGADESLLRRRTITVTRRSRDFEKVVFRKDTNDFNRHSLYELMAEIYKPNVNALPFPDLRQIAIERFKEGAGTRQILVDLESRGSDGSCTNDLWLEWGDLLEIRETEHPISANWQGLDGTLATNITECLERAVNLVIKGRTNRIELKAGPLKLTRAVGLSGTMRNVSDDFLLGHDSFRLSDVLQRSGLLLTSSDLSRVRVRRLDPLTGQPQEWTLDETKPDPDTDFWLRDGDEIEVPEKP